MLMLVIVCVFIPGTIIAQEEGQEMIDEPAEEPGIFSFQAKPQKEPNEKKWFFDLAGMYKRKTGNTDTLDENISTELKYDNNVTAFEIMFNAFYGESNGVRDEKTGKGVIKLDHYIIPRVELFVFSQSEYNKPALLTYRNNSGAGAKFVFFQNPFWKVDLSGAPVYQYEDYENRDHIKEIRWSMRFRINLRPVDWLKLDMTAFYVPEWNNAENYRTDISGSVTIFVVSHVSIKAGYINQYNTNALPGTQKEDQTTYVQAGIHL